MNLSTADMDVFFGAEFSCRVEALDWGVPEFHGILDKEWIEFDGIEREMDVLTAPLSLIPERIAHGDRLTIDGVSYTVVTRRTGEPGLGRVVVQRGA